MVTATSTSLKAKAKLSGERRHGKTREDFEQQLVSHANVFCNRQHLTAVIGNGRIVSDPDAGGLYGMGDGSQSQIHWKSWAGA